MVRLYQLWVLSDGAAHLVQCACFAVVCTWKVTNPLQILMTWSVMASGSGRNEWHMDHDT